MATYLTDDAICLRVHDFSETSQVVGLFTRAHGIVSLIAKGVKRENKKGVVSGPLDLLTSGEVVFVPSRGAAAGGGELGTLAAWDLVDHRTALRKSLAGLNAAMVCAEVTGLLVHPHDPHPELFEELEQALGMLPGAQRTRAVVAYVKAALLSAGYAPQFDACLSCGRAVADGPVRFSVRAGGFVCGAGGGSGCVLERGGVMIGVAGRIVAALARLPLPSVLAANPPERPADAGALGIALGLLLSQVEAVAERAVKTRYLLGSIFGEGRAENGAGAVASGAGAAAG
jgi:DNA repair protein RecO